METPLSRTRPRQIARAVLADQIGVPWRRHLRLEREMAHHGINRLWPSRRTKTRAEKYSACGHYYRRKPGPEFRKSRAVSQNRVGARRQEAMIEGKSPFSPNQPGP